MKRFAKMSLSSVIVQPGCGGEIGAHVFHGKGSGSHSNFTCLAMPHVKTKGHAAAIGHLLAPETIMKKCNASCFFGCLH